MSSSIDFVSISHKLAFLLVCGGLANLFSGYEWLPMRSTDLYSWAPAAQSYRTFRGSAQFIIPVGYKLNGQKVDELPGIQLIDGDHKKLVWLVNNYSGEGNDGDIVDPRVLEIRQKVKAYNLKTNSTSTEVRHHDARIIVDMDDSVPFSWIDWFTKTSHTRVSAYAFETLGFTARKRFGNTLSDKDYYRDYSTSIAYWLLLCVPVGLLLKTTALFSRPLGPTFMTIKYNVVDPLAIICCFLEAQSDGVAGLVPSISLSRIVTLTVANLVATKLYLRKDPKEKRPVAWYMAMVIETSTVIIITYSTFKREIGYNVRVISMTRFILGQLLSANIVAEGLLLFSASPTAEERSIIVSGLTKLAVSFMLYSGGATKLGEAGLGWIDSRYLAFLCLIGRYGAGGGGIQHAFMLEAPMLYVPGVLRAAGMVIIWVLELSSLGSWWYFEIYLMLWSMFMVGSTMAIGVPFRPEAFGPLLAGLASAHIRITASTLVAALGLLTVALWLWNRSTQNRKKDR